MANQLIPPDRKRAAIYIGLIFLCGSLTGAVATNLWFNWGRSVSARADSRPYSVQHRVEKFTRELSLNPEQAKQLNGILDQTHAAYLEHQAQLEAIRQTGRNRIREILNPEQKEKYEQLLARLDQKRQKRR